MSDMKDMLEWFSRRTGGVVQKGSRSHGLIVLDTVVELEKALKAMSDGDKQTALKCIDRVILNEREADRIEDSLCREIVDGSLKSQEREDLLHLIKKTDKISDKANEAGLYLQLIIETETEVPKYLWDAAKQMTSELVLSVRLLIMAFENMGKNKGEVQRHIGSINDQERLIDQMDYANFRRILMSDMDHKGILLMRGLTESLEKAADASNSCAETLAVLMIARGA